MSEWWKKYLIYDITFATDITEPISKSLNRHQNHINDVNKNSDISKLILISAF